MAVIVYRFENQYGTGPYMSYPRPRVIMKQSWCGPQHPNIYNDTHCTGKPIGHVADTRKRPYNYCCAFANMEQVTKWFKASEVRGLIREGFGLSLYRVRDIYCIQGQNQCMFLKSRAKQVKRIENYDEFLQFSIDRIVELC
jgi:hypothetical protein